MNFEAAVRQYVAAHIGTLERDYRWTFSLEQLPIEMILLNEDSWLNKNICLRQALHDQWRISTEEKQLKIISWYIAEWGGVTSNSPTTLALYASATPENLIARQTKGIASWSKALSVRDPIRFAIFDARVSSALNSIQIINKVSDPRYFPDLPSRNNTIINAVDIARDRAGKIWESVSGETFYNEYNDLLINIAKYIDSSATLQKVEMVLFARAEILANEALQYFQ